MSYKQDRQVKIITREDAQAILDGPNLNCQTGLRNRVMMECMYKAGMRCEEVIELQERHISLHNKELRLVNTKGEKPRTVPIPDSLIAWLVLWQNERKELPHGDGYFFCTLDGGKIIDRYVRSMVKNLAVKAQIKSIEPSQMSPHVFRHTYATERIEEGFNLVEIQALLGHAHLATTEIYMHARKDELKRKVANMDKGAELVSVKQQAEGLPKEVLQTMINALQAVLEGYPAHTIKRD